MEANPQDLKDILQPVLAHIDGRFVKLEEIVDSNEQVAATLMVGYGELAATLEALLDALETSESIEDLKTNFVEIFKEKQKMLLKVLASKPDGMENNSPHDAGASEDMVI